MLGTHQQHAARVLVRSAFESPRNILIRDILGIKCPDWNTIQGLCGQDDGWMYSNEGPENSSKKSQESEREAAVADLLLALVSQC